MFSPLRSDALEALSRFIPYAGEDYAKNRNFDLAQESTVSRLSPWVRNRTLPEWEIIDHVLEAHSPVSASKFIDEICWRTYWKGWLQLRPKVWEDYQTSLRTLLETTQRNRDYHNAIEGRTGIDCFDHWAQELVETNYLHNHARMWYASIWVHTLQLPWQLGADWFLRHLLDGDPASNTLSWRWVTGLHTNGKTYLVSKENILKYTNRRFSVDRALAKTPAPAPNEQKPKPIELNELPKIPKDSALGLVVTDDDLSPLRQSCAPCQYVSTAGISLGPTYNRLNLSKKVTNFREASLKCIGVDHLLEHLSQVHDWITQNSLTGVVVSAPSIGPASEVMSPLLREIRAKGITVHLNRHWWDQHFFPHATHGFFRFKKMIPLALEKLSHTRLHAMER